MGMHSVSLFARPHIYIYVCVCPSKLAHIQELRTALFFCSSVGKNPVEEEHVTIPSVCGLFPTYWPKIETMLFSDLQSKKRTIGTFYVFPCDVSGSIRYHFPVTVMQQN